MRLEELLTICEAHRDLGNAVGDQLNSLIVDRDGDPESYNPNALDLIRRDFLSVVERLAKMAGDEDLLDDLDWVRAEMARLYAEMDD